MQSYFSKVKSYVISHKIISVAGLIVVLLVVNFIHGKVTSTSGDTRYLIGKVSKGTIIASVSGTGQVSDVNQIDLKPKVSGNVTYIGPKSGSKVFAGTTILVIDSKDAQKAVRDAQTNLDSAKIALEKLKIQNSQANMSADSLKAYADGLNSVSNTFYDLNSILNGVNSLLGEASLSDNAARQDSNISKADRDAASVAYYAAENSLNQSSKDYAKITTNSPTTDIDNILNETYNTTKLLADAVKDTSDFVNFMAKGSKNSSSFSSYQTTLSGYTTSISTHLSGLLSAQTTISNNKDSVQNSSLDIQSAQLSVEQKQNALVDAQDNLSDYSIRAPFDGTLTNFTLKKLDAVSPSTVVATLVTPQQLATISLNEVDVAKIKLEQKATLTFDAVPDLTISGVVSEIDSIGTVSQGVVTYNVKINFDTQDERVKPSMSVSASIITNIKQDVLTVQNSAIKSQNGSRYVEMFTSPLALPTDGLIGTISKIAPNKIRVEVGLSNNSQTEIISGLKEGDDIVTRTILPSTGTTAAAPSLFGGPANRGGGAGGVRTTPTRGN